MNELSFKEWLEINTQYSKRVISNTSSRLGRADRILPLYEKELYLFELEHNDKFKMLSVTVRSQIKKAVKLYFDYLKDKGETL